MHWIYLIHEFHNLSWITEINELFHDILIYWDAAVYVWPPGRVVPKLYSYLQIMSQVMYYTYQVSSGYSCPQTAQVAFPRERNGKEIQIKIKTRDNTNSEFRKKSKNRKGKEKAKKKGVYLCTKPTGLSVSNKKNTYSGPSVLLSHY